MYTAIAEKLYTQIRTEFSEFVSVHLFDYRSREVLYSQGRPMNIEIASKGIAVIEDSLKNFFSTVSQNQQERCISLWQEKGKIQVYKLLDKSKGIVLSINVEFDELNVGLFLRLLSEI